jgi:hypothetical protein
MIKYKEANLHSKNSIFDIYFCSYSCLGRLFKLYLTKKKSITIIHIQNNNS